MSNLAAPISQANVVDAGTRSPEAQWPEQKVAEVRNLGRGLRWALAFEGGAALFLYAIWHLWQLWR